MRRPSLPRPPALARRPLAIAAALFAVLGSGLFLVRDAGFFAVEKVAVRGASGPDAGKIEAALRRAARDMTTLHVRRDRLNEAVAGFPTVQRLEIDRDLPHDLTIEVIERTTVAVVDTGARRVPVTADGRLLTGATAPDNLPQLMLRGNVSGRVDDARGRRLLELMAAAPVQLRHRGRRAYLGPHGLTVAMRDGPSLYFGTTEDLRAKWAAAARVLADPTAEGARYVDVRVPERVAAGGLAPPVDATEEEEEAAPAEPVAPQQETPAAPATPQATPPAVPPAAAVTPQPQLQPQG